MTDNPIPTLNPQEALDCLVDNIKQELLETYPYRDDYPVIKKRYERDLLDLREKESIIREALKLLEARQVDVDLADYLRRNYKPETLEKILAGKALIITYTDEQLEEHAKVFEGLLMYGRAMVEVKVKSLDEIQGILTEKEKDNGA